MPIVVKHVDDMGFLCVLSVGDMLMDSYGCDANDMGSWRKSTRGAAHLVVANG